MMTTSMFASRILRSLPNYVSLDVETPPPWLATMALDADEEPLGIYENHVGDRLEAIVVTTQGLRWSGRQEQLALRYDCVERIEIPEAKERVNLLYLHLSDGQILLLPVKGRRGRLPDAFEVCRFLDRVRELTASAGVGSIDW
jgi:hypothetical protein